MTLPSRRDPVVLERLYALIREALTIADGQRLHATGIALDTARLSVEEAITEVRAAVSNERDSPDGSIRNGAISPGRGPGAGG